MPETVREFLVGQPIVSVCLVLSLGYLIGKINIKGFQLGSVTGVLFAGLTFGHFGLTGNVLMQGFGFALFMYVVGFEAGPRFFSIMLKDGTKYLGLSLCIAAAGFVTALVCGRLLNLQPGAIAGALAGGMTTTPTLAAAQDAVRSGHTSMPDGMTAEQVTANITTGYAITYLIGLVGLILIIKILPKLIRTDLAAAADEMEAQSRGGKTHRQGTQVGIRAYEIREGSNAVGMKLADAQAAFPGEAHCAAIRRGEEHLDPDDGEIVLEAGDRIAIIGKLHLLKLGVDRLGPEIDDHDLLDLQPETAQVVVTNRHAASRSIEDLGIATTYGCIINEVTRGDVELEPSASLVLQRGDVLAVTAPEPYLRRLGDFVGHLERDIEETDLLTLMLGVAVGVALGTITLNIAGVPVGLGTAGGVMLIGILLGYLRSIYPTFGRVPSGARWFIMEIGLLLFMSGVGLDAGSAIVQTLKEAGLALIITGLAVMVVPVLAGLFVGRVFFKMNITLLLGAICGAMTSTASMQVVCKESRSSVPALGYTGAYALANVILAIAGYLIIRFEL